MGSTSVSPVTSRPRGPRRRPRHRRAEAPARTRPRCAALRGERARGCARCRRAHRRPRRRRSRRACRTRREQRHALSTGDLELGDVEILLARAQLAEQRAAVVKAHPRLLAGEVRQRHDAVRRAEEAGAFAFRADQRHPRARPIDGGPGRRRRDHDRRRLRRHGRRRRFISARDARDRRDDDENDAEHFSIVTEPHRFFGDFISSSVFVLSRRTSPSKP